VPWVIRPHAVSVTEGPTLTAHHTFQKVIREYDTVLLAHKLLADFFACTASKEQSPTANFDEHKTNWKENTRTTTPLNCQK
jgi:hypothetical protein